MNYKELQAAQEAAAKLRKQEAIKKAQAKAKVVEEVMLVDVYGTHNANSLKEIVSYASEQQALPAKYVGDYLHATTDPSKVTKALTAIRLSVNPKLVLVITNRAVESVVESYTKRGLKVIIADTKAREFYTAEEYTQLYKIEVALDRIQIEHFSKDRTLLEKYATIYGAPLGWQFSGPIKNELLTAEALESFREYNSTPYAGKPECYYQMQVLNEEDKTESRTNCYMDQMLMESLYVESHTIVVPQAKARLNRGKGVKTSELETFRDFLVAAVENNLLEELLEEGWTICKQCQLPVRNTGEHAEDGFCQYCGTELADFQVITHTPYYEDSLADDEMDYEDDINEELEYEDQ